MRRRPLLTLALLLVPAACRTVPLPAPQPFTGDVPPGADSFLVVGDSRHGFPIVEMGDQLDAAGHLQFAEALRDERPGFVVHVGDIARTGADEDAWHDFDVDFGPVREAGIAMFPVLGNHEYRGSNEKALNNYFARFPELGRRNTYVRTFRGVRLVFLDSNISELGDSGAQEELDWLRTRLEEADGDDGVRAVMLFAHHPPYSNRVRPGESDWMRDGVVPLAAEFPKVRALFVGHVHSYERFDIAGVRCIVTGGAGSPLHSLRDADSEDARPDLYRGPRGFHYCRVRVAERILVDVVMRDESGGWFVADSFEL